MPNVYDVPWMPFESMYGTVGASIGFDATLEDNEPPVVTVVSPASGSGVMRETPLAIKVEDENALALTLLAVRYPDGSEEVAFDGSAFTAPFASSSKSPTTEGSIYTLVRSGGWRASPTVRVYVVDGAGNVA